MSLRGVLVTSALVAASLCPATAAYAVRPGCTPSPSRAPWAPGVDPGPASPKPFLSIHRGGTNLAPQQTAEAYKSALAFGGDVIEVDLHVLADGALAVFHDASTSDGRAIGTLTTADFKALNAAGAQWIGTMFDPARYLLFDEALAIARAGGPDVGLDIEFKDLDVGSNGGTNPRLPYGAVAQQVADAGLMGTTIWQYNQSQADLVAAVKAVDGDARFNYNILEAEPPAMLFAQASVQDFSVGSSLEKFTPERLAAIHDGCAIAVPHSYDDGPALEGQRIREARARGVDGFQTNQANVAADALDRPVASTWRRTATDPNKVCLVNPVNGFGLLGRLVQLGDGTTVKVGPGGCVTSAGPVSFAGDGAALASSEGAEPVVPESPYVVLLLLVGVSSMAAATAVLRPRRRSSSAA